MTSVLSDDQDLLVAILCENELQSLDDDPIHDEHRAEINDLLDKVQDQ